MKNDIEKEIEKINNHNKAIEEIERYEKNQNKIFIGWFIGCIVVIAIIVIFTAITTGCRTTERVIDAERRVYEQSGRIQAIVENLDRETADIRDDLTECVEGSRNIEIGFQQLGIIFTRYVEAVERYIRQINEATIKDKNSFYNTNNFN